MRFCLGILFVAMLAPTGSGVSFNRDIRPILSRNCFACHGPDAQARQADLRLDTEEGAKRGNSPVVVPGKPEESALMARIESSDPDEVMPPPESHLALSTVEINLLRQWIREGAAREGHWAFQPLTAPEVSDAGGENAIDAFVLRKLAKHSLKPAPPADPAVWLRRVSLDLTGLPPTLSESEAFRRNLPYDQFVTEQLAGDLLPDPTRDQLIATGFNRNHGYSIEGGIIDEEYRVTYANDKTTTFGTLFLGLTMDCTRCHDHKYDPLTMKDYYSLFAFFNTSAEAGAPGEAGRKQKVAPPFLEVEPGGDHPGAAAARVMIMEEKPRETFILKQGLFDQPGEKVRPETPAVLPSFDGYRRDRLGLARWLTSDDNPLFARVTVNRIWQQFFGVGLVKTSDNFGFQGELPSHPDLLDWLAAEFRKSGWDLRQLIRLIVLSETYGQASRFRHDLDDPDNRLLARGPRFRLPAEIIRDQALAAGGLLTRKVGGPSVRPYQPAGIWEDLNAPASHAEVYRESTGPDLYRKSLYTYWRRAVPHPAMLAFDAPSRNVCTVKRVTTNTPLQALTVLHGPVFLESSRHLARQLVGEENPERLAFRRLLTREPTPRETEILQKLHRDRLSHYEQHPEAARRRLQVGESEVDPAVAPHRVAALAEVCHAILNLSETLTRN